MQWTDPKTEGTTTSETSEIIYSSTLYSQSRFYVHNPNILLFSLTQFAKLFLRYGIIIILLLSSSSSSLLSP